MHIYFKHKFNGVGRKQKFIAILISKKYLRFSPS